MRLKMPRSGLGSPSSSCAWSTESQASMAARVSLASRRRARSFSFSSFDIEPQRYRGRQPRTSETPCEDGGYEVRPDPVRPRSPIGHFGDNEVRREARRDLPAVPRQPQCGGRVHGGGEHRFRVAQAELGDGEAHDERQTDRRGAAGVEVRRQRHGHPGLHQAARWRLARLAKKTHGPGEQHRNRVACGQRADARIGDARQMVRRERAELRGQLGAAGTLQLIRMQLEREAGAPRARQDHTGFIHAEHGRLTEHIAAARQVLPGHRGEHLFDGPAHVLGPPLPVFGRDLVRAQERRYEVETFRGEVADDAELLQLAFQLEAIAGLHLDRRAAVVPQRQQPGACQALEVRRRTRAHILHRLENAPARRGDRLIALPQRAALVILDPRSAENRVGVTVDEARKQCPGHFHDFDPATGLRRVAARPDPRDACALDQHGGVAQDFELRQFATAAGPSRPAAGDHGARADEQGPQSPASSIGSRSPSRRAVAMASGYPASAWRTTPMPGSLVSTRSSRRRAAAVPSATVTWPACRELPMPTPPPWWKDTQDAPEAVLSKAFRIGQSAIASDPSRMPSVSRNGDATLPVSRWSRPITIGADNSPRATRSFSATPKRARSPCPSQQIRAGSPWNATRSCAIRIQRPRCWLSGNNSSTRRSVRRRSAGSPDSATQRNGPFPSQNSGRMYSGTNPGISNASPTPASAATVRMLFP